MNSVRKTLRDKDLTLVDVARSFVTFTPPRLIFIALVGSVIMRLRAGPFSWMDLAIFGGLVLVEPITEWLIHVFILHAKPKTIMGRTFDYHAAKMHRAHHRDPWDLRYTVIPVKTVFTVFGTVLAGAWLLLPTTSAMWTALVTAASLAMFYEWVHFLIHTSYRPRSAWMRRLWRMHRLHHFKNEHYWFGVSRIAADTWLNTSPDPQDVARSPTARTLGVDDDDVELSGAPASASS